MTKLLNMNLSRRNLLSGSATGALAIAMIGNKAAMGASMAQYDDEYSVENVNKYLCNLIHKRKSQELTKLLHSPYLTMEQKEMALVEAHCPRCNAHIKPLGVA